MPLGDPTPTRVGGEVDLKVLHVVSTTNRRGAEIFASDLAGVLAGFGVNQRIAVLCGPLDAGVGFPAPAVSLGGSVHGSVRGSLATVRNLRAEIRGWQPDIVQAHGGDALKYTVVATLKACPPIVYRNIGLALASTERGPKRALYTVMMRRAALVVAVADAVSSETVERFRVPPKRVVTIPNAVDARRVAPVRERQSVRHDLGIPDDALVILSLSSLSWEKDPLALVDVADMALRSRPGVLHLIAGDGPMRAELANHVECRGMGERVRLLGQRDDVGDLLAASDALLFASRPDGMEGMPAVLIEAGMAGLAVVSYAVAGVAEIVQDGVTGLLARPGDKAALADALGRILDDARLRVGLGRNARRRCLSRFEIRVQADRYLDLYRQLANSGRPA